MAGKMIIKYGEFANKADSISGKNDTLKADLEEIQRLINSLEGEWESNSAKTIRSKINGMKDRFQQYYEVVDNYVKLIRNTGESYRATESSNDSNAQQFI